MDLDKYLIGGVLYSLVRFVDGLILVVRKNESCKYSEIGTFANWMWFFLSIYAIFLIEWSSVLLILPVISVLLFLLNIFVGSDVYGTVDGTNIYSDAVGPICVVQALFIGLLAVLFITGVIPR